MVLGQNDPSTLSHLSEPLFVFGIRREIIIVDADGSSCVAESGGDSFLPK